MKKGNRIRQWGHATLVFTAGAATGWYVQIQNSRLGIDFIWNIRLLLSVLTFGCLAYFLWILVGRVFSALRGKDMGCFLQADAYSYLVFFLWNTFKYFDREISFKNFVISILVYHVLLKIILLLLADYGRLPKLLAFSFQGKASPWLLASALIVLSAHYMHQRSLAYYWLGQQQNRTVRIGGVARPGVFVPAGVSLERDVELSKDDILTMASGFPGEMVENQNLCKIRKLTVRLTAAGRDESEKLSIPVAHDGKWNEITVNPKRISGRRTCTLRVSVGGVIGVFSPPWSDPLSNSIFISHPQVVGRSDVTRPNVILISIDALRPDHIHSLGYQRPITPSFDYLVREGAAFPKAVSAAPWTSPSNVAMMESLYPFETDTNIADVDYPRWTLAESFAAHHYMTAAITDGGWINSESVFMEGFNLFMENRCVGPECRSEKTFNAAASFAETWKDHPFFLWVYSNEVHNTTWHPIAAWGECDPGNQEENLEEYDAALEKTDDSLGKFITALKEMGLYDNTILVLTSDHGNAFGELHNDNSYTPCGHGGIPYDEQIFIPLIIKPQASSTALRGRTINQYVSNIDIAPTVLDLADIEIPKEFKGLSLVPALEGAPLPKNRRIYSDTSLLKSYSVSFIEDSTKFIYSFHGPRKSKTRFFDLEKDPAETDNLFKDTPEQAQTAESVWDHVMNSREKVNDKKTGRTTALSPELSEQIRKLGYLQ